MKNIESESISDLRPVIEEFYPGFKAAGHKGYRYYLTEISKKITSKYPKIAEAAESIRTFSGNNTVNKTDLQNFIKPIVKDLGETIDIEI